MATATHLVLVQVGPHRCGFLAADVVEVLPAVRVSALPGSPAVVEGAINLRGTVVAVFDLRQRFGCATRPVRPSDRLVIVATDGRRIAVRVDAASDVITVSGEDVRNATTIGAARGDATSIARLPDGLVVIIDPAGFLSGEEAVAVDELLAARDVRGS